MLVVRIILDVFVGRLGGAVNSVWENKEILPKEIMFKLRTEKWVGSWKWEWGGKREVLEKQNIMLKNLKAKICHFGGKKQVIQYG